MTVYDIKYWWFNHFYADIRGRGASLRRRTYLRKSTFEFEGERPQKQADRLGRKNSLPRLDKVTSVENYNNADVMKSLIIKIKNKIKSGTLFSEWNFGFFSAHATKLGNQDNNVDEVFNAIGLDIKNAINKANKK